MKFFINDILNTLQQHPARTIIKEVSCSLEKKISAHQLYAMIGSIYVTIGKAGVKPGDRVVLCAGNSGALIAADLAVFACGAVNVLLNNQLRFDEILDIIEDAGAVLVITDDPDLQQYIDENAKKTKCLSLLTSIAATASVVNVSTRNPDKPMLLHYKFDINGHPLGVILTEKNLNFILPILKDMFMEYRTIHRIKSGTRRVFHYLPLSILPTRLAIYTILCGNNSLVLSMQPGKVQKLLHRLAPHCFMTIPSTLNRLKCDIEHKATQPMLERWLYNRGIRAFNLKYAGEKTFTNNIIYRIVKQLLFNKLRKKISPHLKFILNGLHPLGEETQKWYHMLGITIYQAFGQEETSGFITRDKPRVELEPGYVGYKIPGIELKLTPQHELICQGPNVFAGYWYNPTATTDALKKEWYYTGIIADASPEGNWIIIGRIQNLIILNSGHNIAPEPIEKRIIENFSGIKQAILIGDAKPFLSLILSGDIDTRVLEEELRQYNRDLPHYLRIGGYYISPVQLDLKNEIIAENLKLKRKEITGYFNQAIDQIYHNN